LRAANTGISAGFDARGHEVSRIGMELTDFRTVKLPGPLPRTVFSEFGLVLPGGLALVSLITGLLVVRRREVTWTSRHATKKRP
jgi:apolipoprotein N-acyltransferase